MHNTVECNWNVTFLHCILWTPGDIDNNFGLSIMQKAPVLSI